MDHVQIFSELAINDPEQFRISLDKLDAEDSLIGFVKQAWHVLEPKTELKVDWVVECICDHLEAVTRGELLRFLCNVPPGSMKSLLFNVFWPAWEWGPKNMPHLRYISTAHAMDLALRDNIKNRSLIESDWYLARWGDTVKISDDQNAKKLFSNTATGFRECSPFTKTTGKRGNRVIFDDPISAADADSDIVRSEVNRVFRESITSRINQPEKDAIAGIMQRVHQNDLSGEILSNELGFEHLMIPMEYEVERCCYSLIKPSYMKRITGEEPQLVKTYYDKRNHLWSEEYPALGSDDDENVEVKESMRYKVDPRTYDGELMFGARFSREYVDGEKKIMGSYAVASQFQQRPSPRGGGMFKRDDFIMVDIAPKKLAFVSRGWDLAASEGSGDFTVGLKMGKDDEGRIFILDIVRGQWGPFNVEKKLQNAASFDGVGVRQAVPQEPAAAGKTQKQAIARLLHGYDVKFGLESGDKEARARPFVAQVEAGNVYVVRASWNDAFFDEVCVFPASKYDDQVDACSRAYGDLLSRRMKKQGFAGPKLIRA